MKNSVNLIGYLGQDPKTKTNDENEVTTYFTLATTESYESDDGDKISETTWHNIIAFGFQAISIQKQVKKGNLIELIGKIVYRSYEDKKGITKYITEIHLQEFIKLK